MVEFSCLNRHAGSAWMSLNDPPLPCRNPLPRGFRASFGPSRFQLRLLGRCGFEPYSTPFPPPPAISSRDPWISLLPPSLSRPSDAVTSVLWHAVR